MKHETLNHNPELAKIFSAISAAAEDMNATAFVVGGFVRDMILKRDCKDIDIVVEGSGIEIAEKVAAELNIKNIHVFKNFGTAMLQFGELKVEFVGARKESYRQHSRKPIVEDGSIKDDQNRRDFTINALSLSLQKDNFGALIDPFNGVSDIKHKIIRTPLNPDITYSDDPLRMIRAIRFATQLNFKIEKESLDSITKNAERIEIVSMERIIDELNKIILSTIPSRGFILLFETGLLHKIFPQLAKLSGVEVVGDKGHKDNFYHTLQVLDNVAKKQTAINEQHTTINDQRSTNNELWLRWAAILHDIAKPLTKRFDDNIGWTFHNHDYRGAKMVPGIFKQLKLPLNEKMKYVQKLVMLHLRPITLSQDEVTDSAVRRILFEAGDDIDDLMLLCEADITSKNDAKVKRYLRNFELVREKLIEVEEKDKVRNWQPPISGELIMETFGISPSKEVGIIKDAIREAILNGDIHNDYNEAFDYMLRIAEKSGLKPIKP